MGPMTGRGLGYCAGFGMPGYMNPAPGQGLGMGFGRGRGAGGGRGWRHWFYATGQPGWMRFGRSVPLAGNPWPDQKLDRHYEKQTLKSQADALQSELDFIKKRLSELETAAE